MSDNTYGRGYEALPSRLANLGRYVDNLKPSNLVDHKYFREDDVHVLTAAADMRLSITVRDMESLIRLGLVNIKVNDPGEISFYFKGKVRR